MLLILFISYFFYTLWILRDRSCAVGSWELWKCCDVGTWRRTAAGTPAPPFGTVGQQHGSAGRVRAGVPPYRIKSCGIHDLKPYSHVVRTYSIYVRARARARARRPVAPAPPRPAATPSGSPAGGQASPAGPASPS
jgi:hypothetical protein